MSAFESVHVPLLRKHTHTHSNKGKCKYRAGCSKTKTYWTTKFGQKKIALITFSVCVWGSCFQSGVTFCKMENHMVATGARTACGLVSATALETDILAQYSTSHMREVSKNFPPPLHTWVTICNVLTNSRSLQDFVTLHANTELAPNPIQG